MMAAATGVVATAAGQRLPKRPRHHKLLRKVSRKAVAFEIGAAAAMAETVPTGQDAIGVTGRPVLMGMAGGAVIMGARPPHHRLPSPIPLALGIGATGAMAG